MTARTTMATTNKLASLRVFSSTPLTLLSPQPGSSGSVERVRFKRWIRRSRFCRCVRFVLSGECWGLHAAPSPPRVSAVSAADRAQHAPRLVIHLILDNYAAYTLPAVETGLRHTPHRNFTPTGASWTASARLLARQTL